MNITNLDEGDKVTCEPLPSEGEVFKAVELVHGKDGLRRFTDDKVTCEPLPSEGEVFKAVELVHGKAGLRRFTDDEVCGPLPE